MKTREDKIAERVSALDIEMTSVINQLWEWREDARSEDASKHAEWYEDSAYAMQAARKQLDRAYQRLVNGDPSR